MRSRTAGSLPRPPPPASGAAVCDRLPARNFCAGPHADAGRHGVHRPSWPGESAPLPLCERRIQFPSDASDVLTVHSNFIPALSLARPKLADFFVRLQAGNFGADAYHSIRHRGFRVLSTPHRQSVSVDILPAFLIQFRQGATARRLGLFYEKIKQETPLD